MVGQLDKNWIQIFGSGSTLSKKKLIWYQLDTYTSQRVWWGFCNGRSVNRQQRKVYELTNEFALRISYLLAKQAPGWGRMAGSGGSSPEYLNETYT